MNLSDLPPGCLSADGGIDHAWEEAVENLCEDITTEEALRFREIVSHIRETQRRLGVFRSPAEAAGLIRGHLKSVNWALQQHSAMDLDNSRGLAVAIASTAVQLMAWYDARDDERRLTSC